MNDDIRKIMEILEQERHQMLQFEKLSESMLMSDIEQMEALVDQREAIIQIVNELESQLNQIPLYQIDQKKIREAIKNRADRNDIYEEYLPLFDKGQEIFAVVNRITSMEQLIAQHIDNHRQMLEEKIKESNTLPKIQKYLDMIPNEVEDGTFIKSQSRKV